MLSESQHHHLDQLFARAFSDISQLITNGESGRAKVLAEAMARLAAQKSGKEFDWIIARETISHYQKSFPEKGPGHTDFESWIFQISQGK